MENQNLVGSVVYQGKPVFNFDNHSFSIVIEEFYVEEILPTNFLVKSRATDKSFNVSKKLVEEGQSNLDFVRSLNYIAFSFTLEGLEAKLESYFKKVLTVINSDRISDLKESIQSGAFSQTVSRLIKRDFTYWGDSQIVGMFCEIDRWNLLEQNVVCFKEGFERGEDGSFIFDSEYYASFKKKFLEEDLYKTLCKISPLGVNYNYLRFIKGIDVNDNELMDSLISAFVEEVSVDLFKKLTYMENVYEIFSDGFSYKYVDFKLN